MRLLATGQFVFDSLDVVQAARCPWALACELEALSSGQWPDMVETDPLAQLLSVAADEHHQRVRNWWQQRYPALTAVPGEPDGPQLLAHIQGHGGVKSTPVSWVDPETGLRLVAHVEALVPLGGNRYRLEIASLGRTRKRRQLQLAAGTRQGLIQLGLDVEPVLTRCLGDGGIDEVKLEDASEQWREALQALSKIVKKWQGGASTLWWSSPFDQCGRERCGWCQRALIDSDDLFCVARLRRSQRRTLRAHGIHTMSELAGLSAEELSQRVPDIDQVALRRLHIQATLQVLSSAKPNTPPATEVWNPERLRALPDPREGDVYLDFEGDPAYREWDPEGVWSPDQPAETGWLGLDYLIGLLDIASGDYLFWWADDFAGEAKAAEKFFEWWAGHLERWPEARIFHYAGYELTALQRLASRHGDPAHVVEHMTSDETLVDLYRTVMACVTIGTDHYSLKSIERVYLSEVERTGITGGGESVVAYRAYRDALHTGDRDQAQEHQKALWDYNRDDCLSTKYLHLWLSEQKGSRSLA